MRRSSRSALNAVVVLAAVLLGADRALSDCSATCQPGACTFDRILNTPLGGATLSVDQCRLMVGNIGGSGQDGVVQSGLGSTYMMTTLATPNLSGSGIGTEAVIRQVGVVDGRSGSEISLTRIVNFNGTHIRLNMDCAAIAVARYSIKVYDDHGLVFSQEPGLDPPILIFPRADMVSMACGILPKGDLYTAVSFLQPTAFTIQTSRGNLGPYTGTCLRLTGFAPVHVPTLQEAIENRFRNTGTIPIVELFAGALPHGEPRSAHARAPRRCGLPEER